MLFRRGAYYSQGAKRTTRWAPTSHPFQRRRRSASNVLAKFCVFANARLTIMFCKLHLVVEVFLPSLTFAAASESDPWWVSQVGMVSQVPSLLNLRHAAAPLSGWGALGGAGGRTFFWHPPKNKGVNFRTKKHGALLVESYLRIKSVEERSRLRTRVQLWQMEK